VRTKLSETQTAIPRQIGEKQSTGSYRPPISFDRPRVYRQSLIVQQKNLNSTLPNALLRALAWAFFDDFSLKKCIFLLKNVIPKRYPIEPPPLLPIAFCCSTLYHINGLILGIDDAG
jgi:hypothetical protein